MREFHAASPSSVCHAVGFFEGAPAAVEDEDLGAEVEFADALGDLAADAAVFVAAVDDDFLRGGDFFGVVGFECLHVFGGVEVPEDRFG